MKRVILTLFLLSLSFLTYSQENPDSSSLKEVVVKAYFAEEPLLKVPASLSVVGLQTLHVHQPYSLVAAVNTVPGVRMEERSPGSYRLSFRGSLLRSPFGVRNVKVYLGDFILTDASGNTYLNLLDPAAAAGIEVVKGPEGSIYGANSGGVVLIHPVAGRSLKGTDGAATLTAGSYGLFRENVTVRTAGNRLSLSLQQAYQSSDGYRQHSNHQREYLHLLSGWRYGAGNELKALLLYSDLYYQTPGGLNLLQFQDDPRASRPNASLLKASIRNQTVLTGLANTWKMAPNLRHFASLTASTTGFTNPTFANYEQRDERSIGLRTYFDLRPVHAPVSAQLGLELQKTAADIETFKNNSGERGDKLDADDLQARQGFGFVRFSAEPVPHLSVESALSVNLYRYSYHNPSGGDSWNKRKFEQELMPRIAASYVLTRKLALRASLSRGYSPPTLEEVNPSGQTINTAIQAEKGWNHEAGWRLSLLNGRFYWDMVYFYFALKDAIVRRFDQDDREFYVNAGSTRQQGIESELSVRLIEQRDGRLFRNVWFKNSFTYSHFRFGNYVNSAGDFSGNRLTGVPAAMVVSACSASVKGGFMLFLEHNFSSSLPLNDASSEWARPYHLLSSKLAWKMPIRRRTVELFAGVDNMLNTRYSLGNDLNAFGNRYYNPAATRNYYFGVSLR